MKKLGLIGFPLGHSFSKKYYLDKFDKEIITDINYDLYSIEDIREFERIFNDQNFYRNGRRAEYDAPSFCGDGNGSGRIL